MASDVCERPKFSKKKIIVKKTPKKLTIGLNEGKTVSADARSSRKIQVEMMNKNNVRR